jgi:hypothetical protein
MSRARDTAGIIQYNKISIDSNNAVGIGSSIPDTKLDVNGGVRVTGIITASSFQGDFSGGATGDFSIEDKIVHSGDTNTAIRFPTADTFTVETSGSEKLRITSGGKIGINTSSPNNFLHVLGSDYRTARLENTDNGADGPYIELYNNSLSPADDDYIGIISFKNNNDADEETTYAQIRAQSVDVSDSSEDGRITFHTRLNGTFGERLRITSAGNVSIQNDSGKFTSGTGDDLQLYHTGSASYISNATGTLFALTDTFEVKGSNGNETHLKTVDNGAVELYYDSSKRLETTTDGVDISGTGSIKVPVGTTAQRNGSPTAGDFRYNSDDGQFEGYTSEWGSIGGMSKTQTWLFGPG